MRTVRSRCAALLVLLAACAPAAGPGAPRPEAARQAIEAANARIVAAMLRGDPDAVVREFTGDAVVLAPGMDEIRGRDAIRGFYAGLFGMGWVRSAALNTAEVEVHGATAYEVGTNSLTLEAPGQPPFTDRGKYIVIWKRGPDGAWRIHRDIVNSSVPPR
jgi:uncharacterized protein (TIGR02246 family)